MTRAPPKRTVKNPQTEPAGPEKPQPHKDPGGAITPPALKFDSNHWHWELLVKVGHLTHTPSRPPDVSDRVWELGALGCKQSNLHMGSDLISSIHSYMNDSDASNIDRVGHRRWILFPLMKTTGLGTSGDFSALFSMDRSRENPPDYDFICYPPRGYCPVSLFGNEHAWHISLNPLKYDVDKDSRMQIYPVDTRLNRASKPLKLNYERVDLQPFAIPNAIIARPDSFKCQSGAIYEVVISGLLQAGKPAELSYYVSFY